MTAKPTAAIERAGINGLPAGVDALRRLTQVNYGHFTSMQVRDRAVRGLDLHLARLQQGTRELFGQDLDAERVCDAMRQMLGDDVVDASLRVNVFSRALSLADPLANAPVDLLVAIRPAVATRRQPLRVHTVRYERFLPHLKHVATLPLLHFTRAARQQGHDDALFLTNRGEVSEGTTWNIGFHDGYEVVFPQAPMLDGVSQHLLRDAMTAHGMRWRTCAVAVSGLGRFRCAFAMNATTAVVPIASIDAIRFDPQHEALGELAALYDALPWEAI